MAENLARLPLAVGFLGPGMIGKTLLRQMAEQVMPVPLASHSLDFQGECSDSFGGCIAVFRFQSFFQITSLICML